MITSYYGNPMGLDFIASKRGMSSIIIVFVVLAAAVCLLPYPYSNGESIIRHLMGITARGCGFSG